MRISGGSNNVWYCAVLALGPEVIMLVVHALVSPRIDIKNRGITKAIKRNLTNHYCASQCSTSRTCSGSGRRFLMGSLIEVGSASEFFANPKISERAIILPGEFVNTRMLS